MRYRCPTALNALLLLALTIGQNVALAAPERSSGLDPRLSAFVRETRTPHFVDDQGKLWLHTDGSLDLGKYINAFSGNNVELLVSTGKSLHMRIRFGDKMYHYTSDGFYSAPYRLGKSPGVHAIISLSDAEVKRLEQALAQAMRNPRGRYTFRIDGGLNATDKAKLNAWVNAHGADRRAFAGLGLGKQQRSPQTTLPDASAEIANCTTWIQRAVLGEALDLPVIPHSHQLLNWLAQDPNPKIKAIIVHDPKHEIAREQFNQRDLDLSTRLPRLHGPMLVSGAFVKLLSMPRMAPLSKAVFALATQTRAAVKSAPVRRVAQALARVRSTLVGQPSRPPMARAPAPLLRKGSKDPVVRQRARE